MKASEQAAAPLQGTLVQDTSVRDPSVQAMAANDDQAPDWLGTTLSETWPIRQPQPDAHRFPPTAPVAHSIGDLGNGRPWFGIPPRAPSSGWRESEPRRLL